MTLSSKSAGSASPLSATTSHDEPVDVVQGLLSPATADDIYEDEVIPAAPTIPTDDVYDRKGKGKARPRSQSRTPRLESLKDLDFLDVMAKQAYLSPPLTSSDGFLLGVQNISQVLRKGLTSIDFDVELDLQESGSEGSSSVSSSSSSPSSSPGGLSPSSRTADGQDEGEVEVGEAVVGLSEVSAMNLDGIYESSESMLTPSSALSEVESSRKATVGDSTLQDAGSVLAVVRFPSIFVSDMDISSSESSGTATPLSYPQRREEKRGPVTKEPILVRQRQSAVEVGVKSKRKRVWRRRTRTKIQEEGFSRDFLLIVTLCFGLACAGILIVRPTIMALYGYDTLGGRLDLDFD